MNKNRFSDSTLRFILFLVFIALCWLLGRFFHIDEESVKSWLLKFPLSLSGLIFVVLYVVLTFFIWLSKDLLRIAGAYVFGAYWSTVFIWLAESVNAVILFYLSRALGRTFVETRLKGKYTHLDERLGTLTFADLFFLRAVVLIPFRFLDLACGLTKIPFKVYLAAVVLGSPIRIFFTQFFWVTLGSALFKDMDASTKYFGDHPPVALVVLVYACVTVWVMVRLKKVLWP